MSLFQLPTIRCLPGIALIILLSNVAKPGYSQTNMQPVGFSSPSWNSGTSGSGWGSDWGAGGWGGGWGSSVGNSSMGRNWRLGVTGSNTELGVTVNTVAPNSAAQRAGIVPGDLIVCVNGDQVGLVGNKIFDIAEEIQQNANAAGQVNLLVQQRRSLQLGLVRVQLDDQQGGLNGNLIFRNGTLPANALITVQLENVTRPHLVVRNGSQSFQAPAYARDQVPYSLNFDPSYIFAGDSYRLRAYVTANGRTLFETQQAPMVLTKGNPSRVDLYLSPSSFAFSNPPSTGGVVAGYGNYDAIIQNVTAAYQKYLGRLPTTTELAAWQQSPELAFQPSAMQVQFLGSQEYFDLTGNNNIVWLEQVFREIIGRRPTVAELDQWNRRFASVRYSRSEVLQELSRAGGR